MGRRMGALDAILGALSDKILEESWIRNRVRVRQSDFGARVRGHVASHGREDSFL